MPYMPLFRKRRPVPRMLRSAKMRMAGTPPGQPGGICFPLHSADTLGFP